jgi:diguanylate cyclase (GGDEF)-like protein/PAS domain S-box-containing protein
MAEAEYRNRTNRVAHPGDAQLAPAFFRRIVEGNGVPTIIFECRDRHPVVQYVNRAFSRRTGYAAGDLRGSNWWALHAGRGNENALSQLRDAMRVGRELQIQLRSRCRDGSWFWSDLHMTPLCEDGGTPQYYVGALRDISHERDQLDTLVHNAYHDVLTGLPNRRLLMERFEQGAALARRNTHRFALALVDLDDFKHINDTLGHRVGDELLQVLGARLARATRVEDTVARLGGDEFVVLVQSSHSDGSVAAVEARIRTAVGRPAMIQGRELSVSCSIGVGLCPMDSLEFEALLEHADRRMYAQKLRNRGEPPRQALLSDHRA